MTEANGRELFLSLKTAFTARSLIDECQHLCSQARHAQAIALDDTDPTQPIPTSTDIRSTALGWRVAAVFQYAVNGWWAANIKLAESWDRLEYLERTTDAAEVQLLNGEYRSGEQLNRLLLLASARAKIDAEMHQVPGSHLWIYPAEEGFGYEDLAVLSGLSVVSLRNLLSKEHHPIKTIKQGREAYLDLQDAQAWLVERRDYRITELLSFAAFDSRVKDLLLASERRFN